MPKYAALIYSDQSEMATATPEAMQEVMEQYDTFTKEVTGSGVMAGGEALQPTNTATTVRVRGDQVQTTDGPFAETKEQLGGFYLFNCKDLDEAIEWAAKIPGAVFGSIEVRPVMEFPQP